MLCFFHSFAKPFDDYSSYKIDKLEINSQRESNLKMIPINFFGHWKCISIYIGVGSHKYTQSKDGARVQLPLNVVFRHRHHHSLWHITKVLKVIAIANKAHSCAHFARPFLLFTVKFSQHKIGYQLHWAYDQAPVASTLACAYVRRIQTTTKHTSIANSRDDIHNEIFTRHYLCAHLGRLISSNINRMMR